MSRSNRKHVLAILAAAVSLLAVAGPASAAGEQSRLVVYNGHAGLGTSAYQRDQTDVEFLTAAGVQDGTSNTIML